ncbi:glycosyl hydrolase [Planctomycetota bacterium]|nr:glycosyl hydrolase [Planctomycetota bacterium]
MRPFLLACCLIAAFPLAVFAADPAVAPNTLSDSDKAAGWKLLFDGSTTAGWTNYKSETIKPNWVIDDGALHLKGGGGGDIATTAEYDNFELSLEWKISPGGNSGIMYRIPPAAKSIYSDAIEMQVLDNAGHKDGKNPKTSAGSAYALLAPSKDATKPVGEWNAVRVVADGKHIEHWMNGEKIVDVIIGSEAWNTAKAAGKFAKNEQFASAPSGRIGLQDHGNLVWYRNIKVRSLPGKSDAPTK